MPLDNLRTNRQQHPPASTTPSAPSKSEMRMQSSTATCSYGPSLFFDRQRSAARQDHFARARGGSGMLKRRQREEEEEASVERPHHAGGMTFDPLTKRFVLDRLKRMRVSSPPSSPPEEDSSMDVNGVQDKAIVPLPWWQEHGKTMATTTLRPVAGALRPASDAGPFPAGYPMPPADESCTALVLFDPYQASALNASPRIELVESDAEEEDAAIAQARSPASDDEPASFVRFEEIPDDEDEPMEID